MSHFVLHTWPGQLIAPYVAGYTICWYVGLRQWHAKGRPREGDSTAFFLAFVWPFTLPFYLAEWRGRGRERSAREPRELRQMRTRVEREKLALKHEVELESLRSQLEVVQAARINGIPFAEPQLERGEVWP